MNNLNTSRIDLNIKYFSAPRQRKHNIRESEEPSVGCSCILSYPSVSTVQPNQPSTLHIFLMLKSVINPLFIIFFNSLCQLIIKYGGKNRREKNVGLEARSKILRHSSSSIFSFLGRYVLFNRRIIEGFFFRPNMEGNSLVKHTYVHRGIQIMSKILRRIVLSPIIVFMLLDSLAQLFFCIQFIWGISPF